MTLPPYTNKQKQIILLLYKFRYLTVNHLLKLFNHKDPKRIKVWLKDLRDKKYIAAITDPKDVTKPYIYCLDSRARHILKKDENCDITVLNRLYKERTKTETFINHCLFLIDIYLYFISQKEKDEEVHFFTQQDLLGYEFFPEDLPDAYIAVESKDERTTYLLELFDDYRKPAFLPRKRIKEYLEYCEDGTWQAHTDNDSFPIILFVVETEKRKKHILMYGKAKLEKTFEDMSLFLSTQDAIRFSNGKTTIWQKVE